MEKIVLAINNLRASLAAGGMSQEDINNFITALSLEMRPVVPPYLRGEPGPLKVMIENTDLLTVDQKTAFITDIS